MVWQQRCGKIVMLTNLDEGDTVGKFSRFCHKANVYISLNIILQPFRAKCRFKGLPYQSVVLRALLQKPNKCRSSRCLLCSRQQRCALRHCLERHAAAIILNILTNNTTAWRLHRALTALWGSLERCVRIVTAPRARCESCNRRLK